MNFSLASLLAAQTPPPAPRPILLRPRTLSRKLDVSTRTLRAWVADGRFPKPDIVEGRRLLFWKIETVIAWTERRTAEQQNGSRRTPHPAADNMTKPVTGKRAAPRRKGPSKS
jgi:predicted DNA-binding transcriptional regulator AlpA